MILNTDIIKENLEILKIFLDKYPIFKDIESGDIMESSLYGIGFDSIISFMRFKKDSEKNGMNLIYNRRVSFLEVKRKIVELNENFESTQMFSNKTEKSFIGIWKNYKSIHRYLKIKNISFTPGINKSLPIIYNYLSQNKIDVGFSLDWTHYSKKLNIPELYSREMNMTKSLIDSFLEYAKEDELDIRKSNIKLLTSELKSKLSKLAVIDPGSQLKCISDHSGVTIGKYYTNLKSQINGYGFIEVRIKNNVDIESWIPYSVFEEVSRNRQDILRNLGI